MFKASLSLCVKPVTKYTGKQGWGSDTACSASGAWVPLSAAQANTESPILEPLQPTSSSDSNVLGHVQFTHLHLLLWIFSYGEGWLSRLVKQRRNREKQTNSTISPRTSGVAGQVDKNKANNRVLFLEALYHQAAVQETARKVLN